MATHYGDTPHVVRGVQEDYKHIFYSEEIAARRVPVTFQAGYGTLKAGTAIALNKSAAGGKGKMLPYNPTSFTGAEEHPGRAYLVSNSGTTDKYVYVSMDDSYKFQVGDDVIINDNTTSAENVGAITEIDRTTYTHMAKITFTSAIGGTAFTIARKAYICVEAGDNTNNYSDCVGILENSIETGTGKNSKGGLGSLILGNAVLYEGLLTNVDSAAKTDLGASSFGQFLEIP